MTAVVFWLCIFVVCRSKSRRDVRQVRICVCMQIGVRQDEGVIGRLHQMPQLIGSFQMKRFNITTQDGAAMLQGEIFISLRS